jgi:hypothetical protein
VHLFWRYRFWCDQVLVLVHVQDVIGFLLLVVERYFGEVEIQEN